MSTFSTEGTENRMRWDRRSKSFMEVWYATVNHEPTGMGIWVRYTITAPKDGAPYCELWAFCFDPAGKQSFAGKERFTVDRLGTPMGRDDGALVRIGNAWLSENHLEGEVNFDGRSMTWSFDFEPAAECFQHLPSVVRSRIEKRVSTVCSPNLDVPFTGTVKLDGDLLEFESERGCQSHRWGRKHSLTWTWAHCSGFEQQPDALFEGLAAKTSLGPVPTPTSTFVFLRYDGKNIAFNDLKWALRAKSTYELPTWAFSARTDKWKIAGAARANPEKMFQVTYTDPDGSPRFCANSEIADLAIEIYERSGSAWKPHGSLSSIGNAHLEFGREVPFSEVPVVF
jgi:Tocopherol cyclase